MTFKQKLTKIGNSIGVVIPKEVREALGLDLGSEMYLELSADKKSIVLGSNTPSAKIDPSFFELVKKVDKQYSTALKRLASE